MEVFSTGDVFIVLQSILCLLTFKIHLHSPSDTVTTNYDKKLIDMIMICLSYRPNLVQMQADIF